ncbi:MAG: T9SS type A sorting domain-containing protein [Bacteroidota bacterium]|nr:T9SS type A sorting domain-containing protein [Bacteroidota bacterium]
MKRLLFCFIFLISVLAVSGQCLIDTNYYPVGANYGLDPDSLPDGYVGQFYDEDMTFFLPLDTVDGGLTVTFEDFHITSISLPLGLTWECNNSANSCHYDPAVTQYGCVKVSGTALIAGNYDVQVDLVATHDYSSLVGTENISFTLPLTILPDTSTSSNAGFAMTNSSGCTPVTISFANNNPGMLSYFWDFGNGNTSNLAQPADQIYTQAGQYIVQYLAVQTNPVYFLESIEVVSGNCSDGALTGDPDFFYTVSTPAGVLEQVTCSNYISQSFPLFINISNPLQLTGQSVTIDLDDDDSMFSCTSIEDCGLLTFTPTQQAGTFSTNGGGLSINYTVMEIPANTITTTDTINVYDYPQIPNLVYDTLNNLIYTSGDSIAMQWYYYNSPMPAATDTFIAPTSSGLYSLVIVNEHGCSATSLEVLVVICDTTYQPMLDDNGSTAWMLDSALYSNLQWYDDNGIINGASQSFFPATVSGFYYIVATDEFGCTYSSESVLLSPVMNSESLSFSGIVRVGPNPVSNGYPLTIYIENIEFSDVTIVLIDLFGREVIRRIVHSTLFPYQVNSQELSKLSNGLYYLDISFDGNKIRKKIIKSGN